MVVTIDSISLLINTNQNSSNLPIPSGFIMSVDDGFEWMERYGGRLKFCICPC